MIIGLDASRANVSERTGTERYAWEVITRLLPLLMEHRVRLYVREPLLLDWPSFGDHVEVRVLKWPLGILWSHLRLSWELFWHRPNVLFVPADTVPIIHPKKTITTIHDIAFERFPELYRGRSVQRRIGWLRPFINLAVRIFTLGRYSASERDYHRWSVRQAVRTCSKILTVSEFSKQEIVEFLNIEPSRIIVTYLGINQSEYYSAISNNKCQETLQRLNISKPYFLFIGRLEKKKNIKQIILAYQQYSLNNENPLDLVLAGNSGFGWDEVEPITQLPDLKNNIHILGWQNDDAVDNLQVSAAAFIFISAHEGFGIPPMQSLSAGVPVLSSRHGSLPEVLGDAALYVDSDNLNDIVNSLKKIITDDNLRQKLIASGLERVRGFTWEKTATSTLEALLS